MKHHAPRFLALVNSARESVREMTVQQVRNFQIEGKKQILVDVREDHEWAEGHLPGAVHLGKGIIERDIEGLFPDLNEELILYCGGGFRSVLTAENLQKMGYTRIVSMDGGYRGWTEAGFPVDKP